ncbi:MAG: hypothetical protein KKD00_06155 [Gammaproteobacteria bacterium]|nr:hypothetical protein [Gammaproteobacteria bacterium]
MKRADRLLQIEKHKRDIRGKLGSAVETSRQPLALVVKHPVIAMTASAALAGIIARGLLTRPLPSTIKLLAIPLGRGFIRYALLGGARL